MRQEITLYATKIDVDEELLNRCIVLTVNEDREQTRAIHQKQRESQTLEGLKARMRQARIIRLHRNAQRLLRSIQVVIEHLKEHSFPDTMTRTRRDHMKFLTLIQAVTLLHQHQREIKTSTEDGETLEYIERPDPVPVPGRALVEIAFAGVNFMDTGALQGTVWAEMPNPKILGVEGMGRVVAVGGGVEDVAPGDRVAWVYAPGSYAERIAIPAESLLPVPDAIDDRTAASVMMQGLTASHFATDFYPVQPGDVAFVHAAAGGVGLLLTQIIKLRGGHVIGRVSSEEKVATAEEAGADHVIVDTEGQFVEEALTGQLASDTLDTETIRTALADIGQVLSAADRARGLARKLQLFGSRTALQPSTVDLNAVVGPAAASLAVQVGSAVTLDVRLEPQVREHGTRAPPTLFRQLFHPRLAQRDHRDLGTCEDAVREDQRQDDEELGENCRSSSDRAVLAAGGWATHGKPSERNANPIDTNADIRRQ